MWLGSGAWRAEEMAEAYIQLRLARDTRVAREVSAAVHWSPLSH